ncbi:MAG: hypothetical protein V4527_18775 [Pseudomonadota bacterium]
MASLPNASAALAGGLLPTHPYFNWFLTIDRAIRNGAISPEDAAKLADAIERIIALEGAPTAEQLLAAMYGTRGIEIFGDIASGVEIRGPDLSAIASRVIPGRDGEDGQDSYVPGPQGLRGSIGPQGMPGLWGEDGADGLPGPPGAMGATGPAGADGSSGGSAGMFMLVDTDYPDPPSIPPFRTLTSADIPTSGVLAEAITKAYTQTAHGFTEGMPIYKTATASTWAQTDRDSPATPCDGLVYSRTVASTTYATLSPTDKSANITLSGGNLIATRSAAADAWAGIRSNIPLTGKGKLEVTSGFANATDGMCTGLGLGTVSLATAPGAVADSYGVVKATSGGNATAYSAGGGGVNYAQNACGVGDVAELYWDIPAGKAWYKQAGSANFHGGGDPVTGTTPTFTFTPGAVMYFMLALYHSGNTATVNFGATAFTYTTLSGFAAGLFTTGSNDFVLCQAGLMTATVAQWFAITGEVIGLTDGSKYYTSSITGGLTKTKPLVGGYQEVGRAESATMMRVAIGPFLPALGGGTVASLPSATTMGAGFKQQVTDALAPTYTATVVGGGAVVTPVYSDGTNWKVG